MTAPSRHRNTVPGSAGCRQMIGPTCVVVPAGDFASAFADLSALEPVASVPSLGFDPRYEFFLSCRRPVAYRLLRDAWLDGSNANPSFLRKRHHCGNICSRGERLTEKNVDAASPSA